MNVLSRKLYELEHNVLAFPPADDDIMLHVGNSEEVLLHDRANKIRATVKEDAVAIVESGKSPDQQNEAAKHLLNRLTDDEKAILEQSYEFLNYRLERLVYNWFSAAYPKGEDERVMLRVLWFFHEMKKLNNACLIEDYEWKNNRDEDDPSFDDFAWWDALDAKIKALYPEGVFTVESFEVFERLKDEAVARIIKQHYDTHPAEREALINKSNKKMEAAKNNE